MAEEEAEKEYDTRVETAALRKRFEDLTAALLESTDSPSDASARFCHEFCQILVEHGGQWKSEENPLPLLEMYTVAILCFAEATPSLFPECEHATVVLEKLALSCLDFLLSLSEEVPGALWEDFQASVKVAHGILQPDGNLQLNMLMTVAEENGVWTNATLSSLLSNDKPDVGKVHEFLIREGATLLDMRIKHLIKRKCVEKAAVLAKTCAGFPEFGGKKNFKQMYLVCLCETMSQQELMQEIKEIDCKDALDMICNLESEENEKGALSLCTAFFKRQLLQGDVYCAWELTLFWSKLLIRMESAQAFLDQCRLLAQLSGSVYHILLLIKVIQAEIQNEGLPVCIEMCIQALKMGENGSEDCNTTICKTISCLLPLDLEVKRACQLTEFLVKPTVDSYYAVETLFNEPDQKLEEESLPIPNSLRCDLLLALKMQWPFDPEFWDWKTLKRHCLALMGDEASIVSSIDKLNDSEDSEGLLDSSEKDFKHLDFLLGPSSDLSDVDAERKKKREMKKLRERGFVSARFRNWQAYMQYCVLCDKEFLGHRIVKHALKHVQDGIFRCPICTKSFDTRAVLEPHVASHVKQSCRERLAALNAKKKSPSPAESLIKESKQNDSSPAGNEGQTACPNFVGSSNTNSSAAGKLKIKLSSPKKGIPVRDVENTEDCSCPVTSCQKVFKYFRNLVAHVKAHKNEEEAKNFLEIQSQKAVCQYCRRQFVNITHLNDHLQMHCAEKPYFCIQLGCKCSFHSHGELLMHRKVHSQFQAQCMFPNCGRVFNEAYLLYDHEAQHYITFICKSPSCGKVFYSLSQLNMHHKEHTRQELSDGEGSMLQDETPNQSSSDLELSFSQFDEVPEDSSPLKIKHSIESMLNSVQHCVEVPECSVSCTSQASATPDQSPAKDPPVAQPEEGTKTPKKVCEMQHGVESTVQVHLVPCYVQLQPIPVKYEDPIFLNILKSSDSNTPSLLQDNKLFSFTSRPINPGQNLQNGIVSKASAQPCSQQNMTNEENSFPHPCPFETCTRKYSTSKSLSRHVKNVHFEAFEEWKLSRKYKRIAEIAARKSFPEHQNSNFQSPKKKVKPSNTATLLQYSVKQRAQFPTDTTTANSTSLPSGAPGTLPLSAKFCPPFENTHRETPLTQNTLMQPHMSESWTSPSFDGYNSSYSMQNHYSSVMMPDTLQTYPLYMSHSDLLSERDMDYASPLTDAANNQPVPNPDSHSSVMNEASKYVSSSLRVLHALNGDQTCEMSQGTSSEELGYMEIRQNPNNVISPATSDTQAVSRQNFNPYFSAFPSQTCPSSAQPTEKTNKEVIVNQTDTVLSPDIDPTTHFVPPICKEEPQCFSVSCVSTTVAEIDHDLTTQETTQITNECMSPDDGSDSSEFKKSKKMRPSKRTKWPAIIKDGKVICCRCYREFSSTKSLGGHLSKRSQCRPIDEVDLTADLPTSFLDFLNDPDISTIQSSSLPRNSIHDQDLKPIIHQQSESGDLTSHNFTDIHSPDYCVHNGSVEPDDTYEITLIEPRHQNESSSSRPTLTILSNDLTTGSERYSEKPPTPAGEDGKMIEIERALQRLDLVDVLNQETLKVERNTMHNLIPHSEIAKKKRKEPKGDGEGGAKTALKPFRCIEEGCIYGVMTKEALFKHLSRVHDFSEEKIKELKKNPDQLSPYGCSLCSKTFTRTTGLKIHYKNVHHLSKEEMSRLKIGKEYKRTERPNSESKYANNIRVNNQIQSILPLKTQTTSNAPFRMQCANIKREPTHLTAQNQWLQQDPVKAKVNFEVTSIPQKNTSLDLTSEENAKTVQGTCPAASTTSVLGASVDMRQVDLEMTGNSVTSGLNPIQCGSDVEDTKNIKPIKIQCKEKAELPKKDQIHKNVGSSFDSTDSNDEISLYRPYRCVHEGCVAAFSIQQNLILHYKAMHQSEREEENHIVRDQGSGTVQEFKCQVKECAKVVSKVTSLLKHYLLLHRCTLEKASALLSGVEVGTFQCDQSKCPAYFTCHLKYIDHIKNDHKAIKVSADGDFESVDLTFRCEYEGCDRIYTTKSNLLRHLMKKHNATFETIKQPKRNEEEQNEPTKTVMATSTNSSNGKDIAGNKLKLKKKSKKKEEKARNHWTSFGKPSLKSLDEASAMCTGKFPLQYPCMIKGCESVLSTERHIFKHYTTHGLTERCIEDQRSHFIFCKKSFRLKNRDITKMDDASADVSEIERSDVEENDAKGSFVKLQDPKPEKENPPETAKLAEGNCTSLPMPVVKRKRGRPRKSEQRQKVNPERKQSLRNCFLDSDCVKKVTRAKSNSTSCREEQAESGVAQKLFSPLGFEASILKLFEESSSRNSYKRKSASVWTDMPLKRHQKKYQQKVNRLNRRSRFQDMSTDHIVRFRNPLNLESANNVKIVMDESFSNGADLLLKQLQDMRPMVILKKLLCS